MNKINLKIAINYRYYQLIIILIDLLNFNDDSAYFYFPTMDLLRKLTWEHEPY